MANALKHICNQLMQQNCICVIAPRALAVMHMGHFMWTSQDIPTNFTVFALPQKKADIFDVVDLAVKATEGKGLDASDTKSLTKLHLQVPNLLNLVHHMVNNLAALCAEITGNISWVTLSIYSWVTFFNKNKERITHLGTEDHKFYTKVCYSVDITKEAYLQDCCKGSINAALIQFDSLKTQILLRQYFISLPPVLKVLTSALQEPNLSLIHISEPTRP
eukprot:7992182-Ditylum_brightwellii.AAC.1